MSRVRLKSLVVGVVVAAVALTGCGGDDTTKTNPGAGAVKDSGVDLSGVEFEDSTGQDAVTVNALDNVFKPKYVEIKAGTAVTFRNDGRNTHNVLPVVKDQFEAIESEDFQPDVEKTITFDDPGDYPYYCSLHGTPTKGMIGAVRVVE